MLAGSIGLSAGSATAPSTPAISSATGVQNVAARSDCVIFEDLSPQKSLPGNRTSDALARRPHELLGPKKHKMSLKLKMKGPRPMLRH